MSLRTVAGSYPRPDPDLPNPQRTFDLTLRLALLSGDLYRHLGYEFSQAFEGERFVYMEERRPSVPSGTNEIRLQTERHVSTLFGESQFPKIDTANETARKVISDLIVQTSFVDCMREGAYLGSVGSVAFHVRALGAPGKPARIFWLSRSTEYLTPAFYDYAPDTVCSMTEKYKVRGSILRQQGYPIKDDDMNADFWFMRVWDENYENWFIPWKVLEEKNAPSYRPFTPQLDKGRTVRHGLGFCPWEWARAPHSGGALDGPATWEAGIEHAIALDYQDSQIVAGITYAMSPTTVIETPPTLPVPEGQQGGEGGARPKTPDTIVEVPTGSKVYYLEMRGEGFAQAREKSKELRRLEVEAIHGDRIEPDQITQAHQGAQSMAMINAPMIKHIEVLKSIYGPVVLRLLNMAITIMSTKEIAVRGKVVTPMGDTSDLSLRWGDIYPLTAAEKLSIAQAHKTLIDSEVESRANATKDLSVALGIADVDAETAQIAKETAEQTARLIQLNVEVQDRVQLQ